MRALSLRSPWFWHILHSGKTIENRSWPTSFRGPVLLHASTWFGKGRIIEDFEEGCDIARNAGLVLSGISLQEMRTLGGHLVGRMTVVDCISRSDSPWFQGPYGFVVKDARPLAVPVPCKGALGFFKVPEEVMAHVEAGTAPAAMAREKSPVQKVLSPALDAQLTLL